MVVVAVAVTMAALGEVLEQVVVELLDKVTMEVRVKDFLEVETITWAMEAVAVQQRLVLMVLQLEATLVPKLVEQGALQHRLIHHGQPQPLLV